MQPWHERSYPWKRQSPTTQMLTHCRSGSALDVLHLYDPHILITTVGNEIHYIKRSWEPDPGKGTFMLHLARKC
jgi:hypothetical protein